MKTQTLTRETFNAAITASAQPVLAIDDAPELTARFSIPSIPTLIVCKNGQPVKTMRGVQSKSVLAASLSAAA